MSLAGKKHGRASRYAMVAIGAIGALALVGCRHKDAASAQAMKRPPAMVTVAAATARDVPVYIDQIGRTVPVQTVSIVPQVGGKVIATHVEHGDYVKKGQLLFEIDPRPFQAALESAKASLAQSKAELELTRVELSRVEEAVASAAVSRLEYDQKKSAVAMAEAKVAAAQAAIDSAKLDVEYSKILAPIDGKAGVRRVDAGNVVKAMDQPLLVIQQMDPIYAEFTVTENDLGTVRNYLRAAGRDLSNSSEQGLKVMVDIPADSARILGALGAQNPAERDANATTRPAEGVLKSLAENAETRPAGIVREAREGSLTFLDNSVQDATGTIKLRATLPNADRYFWPGQFVNVRLVLTQKDNAVLVPAVAQQIGQTGPYVYVINAQNIAEIRPITLGQRQGDMLVVDSGVRPGDRVVVSGHLTVVPGQMAVVMNGAPATKPAGAPATQVAAAGERN